MVGACKWLVAHGTTDRDAAEKVVFGDRPIQAFRLREKPILPVVGCTSLSRVCRSLVEGLNVDVSVTLWMMTALMQQLRQSLLHLCMVINRLPPTDIGTGVLVAGRVWAAHVEARNRLHVLELSN